MTCQSAIWHARGPGCWNLLAGAAAVVRRPEPARAAHQKAVCRDSGGARRSAGPGGELLGSTPTGIHMHHARWTAGFLTAAARS